MVRDEVTAQVACNKAELVSEAMSVIGEKDKKSAETTSQMADLRSYLDQANTLAESEIKNVSQVKSEARDALTEQKANIIQEAEEVIYNTNQNAESTIANPRARLATAEGDLVKVNTEKTIMGGDLQALSLEDKRLDKLAKREQQLTKQAADSCSQ